MEKKTAKKQCVFCCEKIPNAATACKHCNRHQGVVVRYIERSAPIFALILVIVAVTQVLQTGLQLSAARGETMRAKDAADLASESLKAVQGLERALARSGEFMQTLVLAHGDFRPAYDKLVEISKDDSNPNQNVAQSVVVAVRARLATAIPLSRNGNWEKTPATYKGLTIEKDTPVSEMAACIEKQEGRSDRLAVVEFALDRLRRLKRNDDYRRLAFRIMDSTPDLRVIMYVADHLKMCRIPVPSKYEGFRW